MTKPIYERLAVVGCGLIGSSVIRAARDAGVVSEIIVADASETMMVPRHTLAQPAGGNSPSRIGILQLTTLPEGK